MYTLVCNSFIGKSVIRITVITYAVIVVIATRCPVSHYRVTKQCGALDHHHIYVLMSRFTLHKFNLQAFVNCLYSYTFDKYHVYLVANHIWEYSSFIITVYPLLLHHINSSHNIIMWVLTKLHCLHSYLSEQLLANEFQEN